MVLLSGRAEGGCGKSWEYTPGTDIYVPLGSMKTKVNLVLVLNNSSILQDYMKRSGKVFDIISVIAIITRKNKFYVYYKTKWKKFKESGVK